MDDKISLLMNSHTELQDQVRFGDTKATAIITFKLVMLAFLRTQVGDINNAYKDGDLIVISLFSIFIVTFMVSTIYVLKVIIPRFKPHSVKKSSIYFSEIASMEKSEYVEFIHNQSVEDLAKDFAEQIHTLSKITVVKYGTIQKSVFYFGISNVCFWIAILRASLI